VVKTGDGDYLTHAMAIEDVHAIRDRSSAWKAWISKKKSCPWVTDEGEMVKKTCIKQAYKYWPRVENSRLETAIHHLNTEAGEGLHIEEERKAPANRPTAGMLEAMPIQEQEYMRELAANVVQDFGDGEGVAVAFDRIKADNLDGDQSVALWSLLPSNVRSGLKKEGKARDDARKLAA
jgi:recombination protein RecT